MSSPSCPECSSDMVLRTARRGSNAGNQFWGCSSFPRCKGIVSLDTEEPQPGTASSANETETTPNGQKTVWYDNLKREEVGEFPSRWDLINGNTEVASLNNEKVILFTAKNRNTIKPLFKKTGYLGDEFTIEYDVLIPNFYDEKIRGMRNQI